MQDLNVYSAEVKKWTEQTGRKDRMQKYTSFVPNLVVGKSELEIQSKQCSACRGCQKNSVCTFA